jgi:cbb3-type cytochrome oxidase cytochrome c subunit
VFEAPGVNLLLAGERLRKDYYHRWMRDPRRIDPATIMPKYYVDENETTLSEPLEGDGYKQMEAIWQWMKELDK